MGTARQIVFDYVFALILIAAALALRLVVWPAGGHFLLFFAAVFLSAWQGGLGPGILTTVTSGLLVSYLLLGEPFSFEMPLASAVTLIFFLSESVLIVSLTAALQRGAEKLRTALAAEKQSAARIADLNNRLQVSMTETHHRVKNSLQLISSLLVLEARKGTTVPNTNIESVISQVRSIALLHEILTDEAKVVGDLETVSSDKLLDKLRPLLAKAIGASRRVRNYV